MANKYDQVVDLMKKMNAQNIVVSQQNNVTKIEAVVNDQSTKNKIWDKIKEVGGENPKDLQADIKVNETKSTAKVHKVKSGDTLSGIAKQYLGDANRYMEIAQYNNISDPNKINVGQEIKIP